MNNRTNKGIVVKVTEKHIVLLCEGGVFRNVPRSKADVPKIGQTYAEPSPKKRLFTSSQIAAVAALFFMIIVSYAMFASNKAEAAYVVAIDINPKVEVYADKHFHVIRVRAMNDDGEGIKESLEIEGHSLFDVVQQIIQSSISKGYLPKDQEGLITTTVIPLQKNLNPIKDQIKETIQQPLQNEAIDAKVYVMSGDKNLLDEAKKEDLSVNQLQFYKSLKNKGLPVTPNEVRNKTMKQLDTMNTESEKTAAESKNDNAKQDSHSTAGNSNKSAVEKNKRSDLPAVSTSKSEDHHDQESQSSESHHDKQTNKSTTHSNDHQQKSENNNEQSNKPDQQNTEKQNQQSHDSSEQRDKGDNKSDQDQDQEQNQDQDHKENNPNSSWTDDHQEQDGQGRSTEEQQIKEDVHGSAQDQQNQDHHQ